MIMDKEVLFADALAFGGTPETIDLESIRPGPGEPLKCFFQGSADLAGCTGFGILDAAVAPADEALLDITENPAGKLIEFDLPSNTQRFVTLALAGTVTAGSFTAVIVRPGNQTNL